MCTTELRPLPLFVEWETNSANGCVSGLTNTRNQKHFYTERNFNLNLNRQWAQSRLDPASVIFRVIKETTKMYYRYPVLYIYDLRGEVLKRGQTWCKYRSESRTAPWGIVCEIHYGEVYQVRHCVPQCTWYLR